VRQFRSAHFERKELTFLNALPQKQVRYCATKCARIQRFHDIGVTFERKADSPNC
jgi:hypothetical protein